MTYTIEYREQFIGFSPWLVKIYQGITCICIGNFDNENEAKEWAERWCK